MARPRRCRQFSSSVQLVEVYATVTDAKGGAGHRSRQSDFEVLEDGASQEVTTFAAGEFPLTVALGVDPASAWRRTAAAGQAGVAGVPSRAEAGGSIDGRRDQQRGRCHCAAVSTDRAAQSRAISALDAWSTTALHDAIVATLDRLEPEPGRQAIVVFSDGADRYSKHSAARGDGRAPQQCADLSDRVRRTRPALLAELAVLTGGRSFPFARRARAREDAGDDRARAALPVSARLHAREVDAARRARSGGRSRSREEARAPDFALGRETVI